MYLVKQSPNQNMFLQKVCGNLTSPITGSPNNGPSLALATLTTLFNTLKTDQDARYHIFFSILRVIRTSGTFEVLKPQLKNLESWIEDWEVDEESDRKLYLAISDVAKESGEEEEAYQYLVKALRTFDADEASKPEAHDLSLRALKAALTHPSHFDFQDLTDLDSVQALRTSEPIYFQLLELFTSEVLDDYNDFKDEHDGWLEAQNLDTAALNRKMRLLTLASLAAQAGQSRSLAYDHIAKGLQIPPEDVEMWVIDVIRAGLVEGKLSQLNRTFLIHRSTYRVFGENQWREVASRLDLWRNSLTGVLEVIRNEKANFLQQREAEEREKENKLSGNTGMNRRQQRGPGGMQPQPADLDLE